MMVKKDISFPRGDTLNLVFTIVTDDGNYILTEDDRLYLSIKQSYNAPLILQKTFGNGISVDTATGAYTAVLASVDTSLLTGKCYMYDIELVRGFTTDKITTTLVTGKLSLENTVTDNTDEV